MIPTPFDYEVATSLEHAVSLLAGGGEEAKLLAGGHSLLPLMKLRLARPTALVDIGGLDELREVREQGEAIAIGALSRHHDLERSELLREACPLLAHAAGQIGDPQVRHRGTIGGSIAHGDPASDLPAVLLALDAELVIRGGDGERRIAAADFFLRPFETALEPHEILIEVRVPRLRETCGSTYLKFGRRAQDWAIVGVAAVVERTDGRIERAAIGLTNMGPTPVRAAATEASLSGIETVDESAISAAASRAADGAEPPFDTYATAEYRAALAEVLVRRAVRAALV
jgi:carbon-monoxide dehydrogenase medium subunit